MLIWNRYPLFRAFLALAAGILLANFLQLPFSSSLVTLTILFLLCILFAFLRNVFFSYKNRWIFGASATLCFFLCGIVSSNFYTKIHSPLHLADAPETAQHYLLQLEEYPLEKKNSFGARATLLGKYDSTCTAHKTQVMLYLAKNQEGKALKYGDQILVKTRINKLNAPKNPYEFDYRDYLNLKAIYYQVYADTTSWTKVSSGHGWWLLRTSMKLRRKMISLIDQWDISKEEKAITNALLLGYRYDIEDDQLKAYASAGAMHVLAVSGLHVGIVYLMASYALFFLTRIRYGKETRMVILILLLWFYACLTGLSASVVRASTMFTFVAFGTAFKRPTSIYNTILGSAILLLLIKPTYLFEVGFQLSYAAVFGIVWLQPKLQSLWQAPNWILNKLWGITTVSIAAQLATFPLGLYYFHQFPSLFLLSNLMVIPLVTALMYIGLVGLIISAFGYIPDFLVWTYRLLLGWMNTSVNWVEQQAFLLIEQIHITRFELVLLYVIILSLGTWIFIGSYKRLVFAMSAIVLFSASQLLEQIEFRNSEELVVYSVKDHGVLGLYSENNSLFLADSAFTNNEDALTFHVKHHWWARDVDSLIFPQFEDNFEYEPFVKNGALLHFSNNTFWLPGKQHQLVPEADYWILFSDYRLPDSISAPPRQVVLASNLSYFQRKNWKEWGLRNNIKIWDTAERGAFTAKNKETRNQLLAWLK